jgi:uncharacterized repeat protein (TIGR03803 family)
VNATRFFAVKCVLLGIMGVLVLTSAAFPAPEKVLYSFQDRTGKNPETSLVFDAQGNLYGSASEGGIGCIPSGGCGVVFKLTRGSVAGHWHYQVLHGFNVSDGRIAPNALILDAAGNLYGTTVGGGQTDCGTVFQLTPTSDGGYAFTIVYEFAGPPDACEPYGRLVFDAAGNLYGTTFAGGSLGMGTVFELSPTAGGGWSESVLYSFAGTALGDGAYPSAGLVIDETGDLYGTTQSGGNPFCELGCGTVFELTPDSGTWTEAVLYVFGSQSDGGTPQGGLLRDAVGNLYGTAGLAGLGCGTVFQLSAQSGSFSFQVIYSFVPSQRGMHDGCQPTGQLAQDAQGNVYGTTLQGGRSEEGMAYELSPNPDGTWSEKKLHTFSGLDGSVPVGGVILDSSGNLYGTTDVGGANGVGTVFEMRP